MLACESPLVVVIPAAGIGKRMQADCPKQYLKINGKTVLEHTVERVVSHPRVDQVIVVLNANDKYFDTTAIPQNEKVVTVIGGEERG